MNCPQRKRNRLELFNYSSPGSYFITICTSSRACILSDIVVGDGVLDVPQVQLSSYGKVADKTIQEIDRQYPWLTVDRYVIMPNHIHLLLTIGDNGPSGTPAPTNAAIPRFVSTLKRLSNRNCGKELWQRSYHDHIIRGENDYLKIWNYIETNPYKWEQDCFYPQNRGEDLKK